MPCDQWITNGFAFVKALHAIDFAGTFVYMPFHDEKNPAEMTRKLKSEVACLRDVVRQVTVAPAAPAKA